MLLKCTFLEHIIIQNLGNRFSWLIPSYACNLWTVSMLHVDVNAFLLDDALKLMRKPKLAQAHKRDLSVRKSKMTSLPTWDRTKRLGAYIALFRNGYKGEIVKYDGGKTNELLCNEPWRISTGKLNNSTQKTSSCVHVLNRTTTVLYSDRTIENIAWKHRLQ